MATFVIVWLSNAELDKHRNTHSLNWETQNVTLTLLDTQGQQTIANSTAGWWPGNRVRAHNIMAKQLSIEELQRAPSDTNKDT